MQQFLHFEEIASAKIKPIFKPIIDMVERQDKKYLFRLPEKDALRVDWLVLPLEDWLASVRFHIVLRPYYHPRLKTWVLSIFWEAEPYTRLLLMDLLIELERPLEHETTKGDRSPDKKIKDEVKPEQDDRNVILSREIGWYPLSAPIDPADIANTIINAAKTLYKGHKMMLKLVQERGFGKPLGKTGQSPEHPPQR